MAEEEYNKKLESLQQYIPFLNNMIVQLKDPRKKNREQQLQKMMSLHSMITDKRKKLKLETLIKCEDVILKLYNKVKSGIQPGQQALPLQNVPTPVPPPVPPLASTPMSPITPSSPSPPREVIKTQPVVIPTEKVTSTSGGSLPSCSSFHQSHLQDGYNKPKIDIYSSAADSLKQLKLNKSSVFSRLGHDHKPPDMSKPPITIEDLEALQASHSSSPIGDTEAMSLVELTSLREKLQKQLSTKNSINTTVRNSTILTKKSVDKPVDIIKPKVESTVKVVKHDVKPKTTKDGDRAKDLDSKSKGSTSKVVKSGDIFGSALSSIDNKILEGGKLSKDRKEERRSSIGSGASKRDDKSSSSRSDSKDSRSSKDDRSKSKSDHHKSSRDQDKSSKHHSSSSSKDRSKDERKKDETSKDKVKESDRKDKPKPVEVVTYKRLADKYNPKPRKPSLEVPAVSNEVKKIPESGSQLFQHPLASPASSTNSMENEFNYGKKTEVASILSKVLTTNKLPANQNHNLNQSHDSKDVPFLQRQPTRPYTPFNQPEVPVVAPVTNQYVSRPGTPYGKPFDRNRRVDERGDSRRFHDRSSNSGRDARGTLRDPRHRPPDTDRYRWVNDKGGAASSRRDPRLNRHGDIDERAPHDDDKFVSPLDKLYGSGDASKYRGTGKGFGGLNFRIPKVKKDIDVKAEPAKVELKDEVVKKPVEDNVSSSTEDPEAKIEVKVDDGPVATSEITSSTHLDSSTGEVSSNIAVKDQKNEKESQDIINKFLKDLLQNEQTKAAASLFIDKVSDSVNDERLKLIVEAVRAAKNESEDKPLDTKEEQDDEEEEEEVKVEEKPPVTRKVTRTLKPTKPKRRRIVNKKILKEPLEEEVEEEEEPVEEKVVVSVGERIKKRKRMPIRKQLKKKTELDMLHEDIQDMFIRDGVLTATGKRVCCLLNDDSGPTKTRSATAAATANTSTATGSSTTSPETPKARRGRSAKNLGNVAALSTSDRNKLNVRDVRVIIPKISVPEMIENASNEQNEGESSKRYSLRRHNKEASYNENDSESDKNDTSQVETEHEEKSKVVITPVPSIGKAPPTGRKTARKRTSAWASGIIKKNKRAKQSNDSKDDDKLLELIGPDKNYYFNKTTVHTFSCKLCEFRGRNITAHYKFEHPDSEVLTSRLSPSRAARAIKESLEQDLESQDDRRKKVRQMLFQCIFCDTKRVSPIFSFYDHLTTHTGEYRHICDECPFAACNAKALTLHCSKQHNNSKNHHIVPIKKKVFGYMCGDCNFVQMDKKTVENHVNIFHLGDDKKVYRINLTLLPYEEYKKADKEKHDEEEEEEEETTTADVTAASEVSMADEDNDESNDDDPGNDESDSVEMVPPPLKKIKTEIDMTVFTCKTDIQEENDKIEMDRLQRMTELNDSVKTNRQSLNFIDELSNRLMRENEDGSPEPSEITVKHEPMYDSDDLEIVNTPIVKTSAPPTTNQPSAQTAVTSLTPAMVTNSLADIHKDDTLIRGMIQKLRGILNDDDWKDEGPPQLNVITDGPPQLSLMTDDRFGDELKSKVLITGYVNLYRGNDGLSFGCRVPSCLFISRSTGAFIKHLRDDHERVNYLTCISVCKVCNVQVTDPSENDFLVAFFKHVMDNHSDFHRNIAVNSTIMRIAKDCDYYEYLCRFNFCSFETKDRDEFVNHVTCHNVVLSLYICPVCKMFVECAPGEHLLVSYLTHVEENHLAPQSVGVRLRTRRLSGDILSAANDKVKELAKEAEVVLSIPEVPEAPEVPEIQEVPEVEEVEDNPFPFKIIGVVSLAEENLPALQPIADKTPTKAPPLPLQLPVVTQKKMAIESVVLKEGKLTPREKAMARKSAQAYKKFMETPKDLYKCPKFFCRFSTEGRAMFESHIKAHAAINDEMVCCVYCDYKTPLSQSGLHIDLRHSDCRYSCSQCLYRAICKEYVMLHMKVRHKGKEMIISLPPKTTKTVIKAKVRKWTPLEVCLPYLCGQPNCTNTFEVLSDFHRHLEEDHGGVQVCGEKDCDFTCLKVEDMLEHWISHERFRYNCLLCKSGYMEAYSMLEHYSATHPNQVPNVVDRATDHMILSSLITHTCEMTEQLKHVEKDILTSINPDLFSIVTSDKGEIVIKKVSAKEPPQVTDPVVVVSSPKRIPLKIISKVPGSAQKEVSPSTSSTTSVLDDSVASTEYTDMIEEINESTTTSNGLMGYQLFRCAYCDGSFSNSADFKNHCLFSKKCQQPGGGPRPFKCVHCQRMFKNAHGILEHIQYHGQLRFACSLCNRKFPSTIPLKLHMRVKHSVTNAVVSAVIANRTNVDKDEFVARPTPPVASEFRAELVKKGGNMKNIFSPDQIDLLPKRHIFTSVVSCFVCSYSTKVRTNMQRHLQFHLDEKSVPAIAPVNPVPCLDKNEKMFDKMTNLAISSIAGSSNGGRMGGQKESKSEDRCDLPEYVPSHRRFACCVDNCNYLCPEEGNLRHHLLALHQNEQFRCPHCRCELKSDVDQALKHLKLHELHLYKCQHCDFHHHLRHKVEKHTLDKHPARSQSVIVVRYLAAEIIDQDPLALPSTSISPDKSLTGGGKSTLGQVLKLKIWHCALCKHKTQQKSDIITHCLYKHNVDKQFKCTLCSYNTDDQSTFDDHFRDTHPSNDIDIIYAYYKNDHLGTEVVTSFDTTPLWQRDRPRVRHIRGILFEDASTSSTTPKTMTMKSKHRLVPVPQSNTQAGPWRNETNLDIAIDAVAKGVDGAAKDTSGSKDDDIFKMLNQELEEVDMTCTPDEISDRDDVTKSPVAEAPVAEAPVAEVMTLEKDQDDVVEVRKDDDDDDVEMSIDDLMEVTKIEDAKTSEEVMPALIVTPSREVLTKRSLEDKYGLLVSAAGKAFKCPICSKFKSRRLKYFLHHLLSDLGIDRFRCKMCVFRCVTYDEMSRHFEKRHGGTLTPSNVGDLPLDESLILWMQMLIHSQAKDVVLWWAANSVPKPMGADQCTTLYKSQCQYCNQWFKNTYVLKEHEIHHWATVAYSCERCQRQFDQLDEFLAHCKEAHSTLGYSYKCVGPCITGDLSHLKSPQLAANNTSSGAISAPLASTSSTSNLNVSSAGDSCEPQTDVVINTDGKLYLCYYCLEGKNGVGELHAHWLESHAAEGGEFKYREMPAAPSTGASVQYYCCTYCHEKESYEALKRHHGDQHSGLKFSIYQLICIECAATFMHQKEIRAHFTKSHPDKRLTYATIENKAPPSDKYFPCTKCPFKSATTGGIRSHVRKHVRPMDCKVCGAHYVFAAEAKLHFTREHSGAISIEENKGRMQEYEKCVQESLAMSKADVPLAKKIAQNKTLKLSECLATSTSSSSSGNRPSEDVASLQPNLDGALVTAKLEKDADVDVEDDDEDMGDADDGDDGIDNLLGRLLQLDEEEELGILSTGGLFDDL